jgi:TetR/AcrR family transcriptional regulator, repressor for neighboring sulfatase
MGSALDDNAAVKHRTGTARDALIDAAKRLLPDRAPGTIAGRDLAAEAGVNYGLVHHYFGGKEAALRAGLRALRDDFVIAHGDVASMPLLTASDPYLKALVRWHLHDSEPVEVDGEFPLSAALVASVASRMEPGRDDASVEAKARAIAMTSVQLCFAVFGPVLLEATGVRRHERQSVETALASLYDSIALKEPSEVEQ